MKQLHNFKNNIIYFNTFCEVPTLEITGLTSGSSFIFKDETNLSNKVFTKIKLPISLPVEDYKYQLYDSTGENYETGILRVLNIEKAFVYDTTNKQDKFITNE